MSAAAAFGLQVSPYWRLLNRVGRRPGSATKLTLSRTQGGATAASIEVSCTENETAVRRNHGILRRTLTILA